MCIRAQSFNLVHLFATPWTPACKASLSITNSRGPLKVMSIASVMPPNRLILSCPLLLLPSIFPSIKVFSVSQFFASGGQSIGVSASASVLSVNIQDWFPLGWTDWISLWESQFLGSLIRIPGVLLNSSPLEAKNPSIFCGSATTFHLGGSSRILQDKVRMLGALVLCSPSEHVFCCTLLTLRCACVNEWHSLHKARRSPAL